MTDNIFYNNRAAALSKRINWNLFYTFVVIAEEKSISGAAKVLGRGQPAVSVSLKKLEHQLGYRLAERGPKAFTLTNAGQILYREACELCGSIDRLTTLLSEDHDGLSGTVRLTIASHMTSPLIDESLAVFHNRYPNATFLSTVLNTPELLNAMSNGLLHFGIGPASVKRQEFNYLLLFREHCGFYCGRRHRLFGREGLTLSDLMNEKAVTYSSAVFSDVLQSITDMRHKVKFADPLVGVSNHLEEVRRMVVAGLGIGAIPVHIAERDVRDGLLWRLPPYENAMPLDIYLITSPRIRPSRTEEAFIQVLEELVATTPLEQRTYPLSTAADVPETLPDATPQILRGP